MGIADIPLGLMLLALGATLVAGFVKGAVGFALPMIMISTLGSFLPAETALAALILPTLVSNLWQAFRTGWRPAWQSLRALRIYLGFMLVFILIGAQMVRVLSPSTLLILIGAPVTFFALIQLLGVTFPLRPRGRRLAEPLVASAAGFVGGMSGVWGPPLVAFLTAIDTPKREQMRVQGVVYGLGALALALAHVQSGVLNRSTLPLSALMLVPTLAGMALGLRWHDRLPQAGFRRATLVVLVLAGLNLLRRALLGG